MLESVSSVGRTQSAAPVQTSGVQDYRIQRGDTLTEIARRFGTDVDTLARMNGISNPNRIVAGQAISVPSGGKTLIVQRGDTLGEIATKNNTSVGALMKANPEIRNANQIYPGQVVKIPVGGEARVGPRVDAEPVGSPKAPANSAPVDSAGTAAPATLGVIAPGKASLNAADIAGRAADGRGSKGECYAWVKRALQKSGAVPVYLEGVPAKGAGPQLEKYGFVNVLGKPGYNIKSPYDAPKGAVLVYGAAPNATDRNAKYGHIEIRTDKGFASDYHSANARTGAASNGLSSAPSKTNGRVLIGVYIKPDAGAKPVQVPASQSAPPEAPVGAGAAGSKNDLIAKLGEVITIGEGNYESYNSGTKGVTGGKVGNSFVNPGPGTVTNKTINEIIATDGKSGYSTDRFFATGKYQTTIPTLKAAKEALGLTGNEKYTPQLQERVFREFLLQKAGGGKLAAFVIKGVGTVDSAQYAAAKEWASIAVPAGLRIGQYNPKTKQYESTGPISNGRMSYYEKPGQNAASSTATKELRELLVQIQNSRK